MYKKSISVLVSILIIWACTEPKKQIQEFDIEEDTIDFYYEDTAAIGNDTIAIAEDSVQIEGLAISPEDVSLSEELLFDKYTLADEYPYKKKTRTFQWSKIKEYLAFVENFQNENITYAVLQNYRNLNGMAPLVKNHTRNHYDNTIDSVGVERSQSIPLFGVCHRHTVYVCSVCKSAGIGGKTFQFGSTIFQIKHFTPFFL